MATQWKVFYGPTVTVSSAAAVLVTVPANQTYVITKFSISNKSGGASIATIEIAPDGATYVQVYNKTIPVPPVLGGVIEVVELEGQIIPAGGKIRFTDSAGSALVPWISGVAATQQ